MKALLRALHALRREFGPAAAARRARLLARTAAAALRSPELLQAYHEELLYLCAYPDDRRMHASAQRELGRVARVAQQPSIRAHLVNSGICGTAIEHAFTLELLAWLARRGPTTLVWPADAAALEELLLALVLPVERDGLADPRWTSPEWLRLAAGGRDPLAWLVERLLALPGPLLARDRLIESLALHVCWRPGRPDSRTFARFPARPFAPQRGPLLREFDLAALLEQPLHGTGWSPGGRRNAKPALAPLPPGAGRRVIDVARATLAVRQRETDPVTWANPAETWLFRLERGVDVAVLGLSPERRLPIESYFGFVAARNRVPLAYGGGWVFFERCEIGVNLFETFRGGESAYLFGQVLRVYRQLFHVGYFQVDPFQIGADNEEAIQSGAFWFYYRLGFRPARPELSRLAEREAGRIAADREYRTPARVLRRFATDRLVHEVAAAGNGARRPAGPVPELERLGLAVTRWAARHARGDRAAAAAAAARRLHRLVGDAADGGGAALLSRGRPGPSEAAAFEGLAPLMALVPGLARWPADERVRLGRLMYAKGGRGEREFVLALQQFPRLRAGLQRVAGMGVSGVAPEVRESADRIIG